MKYKLIEIPVIAFSLLAILLIAIVESVIQIVKPGYSIWFKWIDGE